MAISAEMYKGLNHSHCGITCGHCGHIGEYDQFYNSEVFGELPRAVIQCPACSVAVQLKSGGHDRIPAFM